LGSFFESKSQFVGDVDLSAAESAIPSHALSDVIESYRTGLTRLAHEAM
jgi:hypothetical protein